MNRAAGLRCLEPRDEGALAGSRGLAALPIMADCGKGRKRPGSLRCPLLTLRLMPAAQWPQEIGSWAGNRAGNRQQQSRPRLYLGPLPLLLGDRQAGEKPQAGRCPSGIPAVSEQTPPPAQTPSATMMVLPASPCWRPQRDPVKPTLEPIPLSCRTSALPCPWGTAELSYWRPVHRSQPFPDPGPFLWSQGLCTAVAVWNALRGCSGPHACGEASRTPHCTRATFWLHCCLFLAGRQGACHAQPCAAMPRTALVPGSAQ